MRCPQGVATGHTMDDQAETILLNLLRGSGADGLAGMEPGHRHPLLGLRRHETHAVCTAMELAPVHDASNQDPAFLRNRVRHELLPLCADIAGRDPVPLLARQAGVLRDEVALLNALALQAAPDPQSAPGPSPPCPSRWLRTVGASKLAPGGRIRAGGTRRSLSSAEVERVLVVAAGNAVATEISGGRRVRRRAGRLTVDGCGSDSVNSVSPEEVGDTTPSWAMPGLARHWSTRPALAVAGGLSWVRRSRADYAD